MITVILSRTLRSYTFVDLHYEFGHPTKIVKNT